MLEEMALTLPLSSFISPMKEINFNFPNSFSLYKDKPTNKFFNFTLFSKPSLQVGYSRITRVQALKSDGTNSKRKGREPYSDSDSDDDEDDAPSSSKENDPYAMNLEERQEWRRKIRQVMDKKPDIQEVADTEEKKKKMQKLINDYQLVVEEEDPNWPQDADGWGFSLGQFFDKITIQNKKKEDNDDGDDNDVDDDKEIEWQDDNYIRPIKDIKAAEWEETMFKDISPLIILVHNRYRRPKENERIRDELEKAVHIIWNCGLPSPRCVALDAVVETELVAALKVSAFPEVIFTKAGKILFRDKAIRNADEWSKIMAFYYYRGAKPPCLTNIPDLQENIPSFTIDN
ncbi:thioredoxin-like fold domain-containing protein MRL7L, chloroplastic isoform X1 [Lathyrus oleraceus]|uniref:Thioredoxin-like fold domain-containing protein mrl7l n=2 Tax=Pisum sativum TaxID=3888 RepID=A0A9D5AB18_PEA|nr:thioredoxin-like fold domain-containing protein MRL7L, chloroplastic isoform X1 [Pisum sativum]KAI5401829.1 Thioredoxin-like fold domain-containing protein mrl7l [Pisum sativum]